MGLSTLLAREEPRLRALPHVTGVGRGLKISGGQVTDREALVVFVSAKVPLAELSPGQVIPREVYDIEGAYRTDVVVARDMVALGSLNPEPHRQRQRPLVGGLSVMRGPLPGAGTLGGIVLKDGVAHGVSNAHVIYPNWIQGPFAPVLGEPIYQPAGLDGGNFEGFADKVGELTGGELVTPGGQAEEYDIADFRITVPWEPLVLGIGAVRGLGQAQLGQRVTASGRSSGASTGQVRYLDVSLDIGGYGGPTPTRFVGLIGLTDWTSRPGDSGAWLMAEDTLVGIVFAGGPDMALALSAPKVFAKRGYALPPPPNGVSLEEVFNPIWDLLVKAWGWDNRNRTWRSYDTQAPQLRDLWFLEKGMVLDVTVSQDTSITLGGITWPLKAGQKNWVGWTS